MFKLRTLGLVLASLVTALAVAGAASLIALDFVGVDGLARAWAALSGWLPHAATAALPLGQTGWGASR